MPIISTNRINTIYQYIESGNYIIEFNLEFGKGIDSTIINDDSRMNYNIKDTFAIDEVIFDDGVKNYRIIGTEAPIVSKISNLRIRNKNENSNYKYEYGIGFAMDKDRPEYSYDIDSEPNNIERDGKMWHIRGNNNNIVRLDQNAGARYQMYLKKAKKVGEELTEKEQLYGVEETTDYTGQFYITIMVCESKTYIEQPVTTRGATRGLTRGFGGATRGGSYDTGRIGYGSVASTSSTVSSMQYVDSPKLIIPFRFKVFDDSEITDIMGSKDLASARSAEELQKMYQPKVF
tara:strand:- start:10476 stop:11345 length:870 start_codon:yes stop_codon:yes gene_type:complete